MAAGRIRTIGHLRAGGSGFSPSQISFTSGLWLDPSDISTGFQNSAGTTPQTASGQSTGLRLDKHLGLARSSELCTDPGFDSAAAWNIGSGWAVSGGKATGTASSGFLYQNGTFVAAGDVYEGVITISNYSAGSVQFFAGSSVGPSVAMSANGTYTLQFVALNSTQIGFVGTGFSGNLDNCSFKKITGNHVLQATTAARPEYDVLSGISSDFCDGSNDGYSTQTLTAGTLTSAMDCFIPLNRSSTASIIAFSNGVANASFFGKMSSGTVTSGSAAASVGSAWTCFVDGVQVGGTATTTADALHTAMGSGAYHVLEFHDLDLSAWTQFTYGLYTSFMLGGDQAQIIVCPSQTTAIRNKLRTYVGAKAGLSL